MRISMAYMLSLARLGQKASSASSGSLTICLIYMDDHIQ
jgi:hypothetical protein